MWLFPAFQKRHNLEEIFQKLQTMATISQTQLTIQMLLSNGDFVGALDLITTTRDILTTDLAGLVCFRHLSHQLTEMEKFIDKMMSMEFRRALSAHLNRSLEMSTAKEQMLNRERFVAIVTDCSGNGGSTSSTGSEKKLCRRCKQR